MPDQNQDRESSSGTVDHTLMEITNMVPSTSNDVPSDNNILMDPHRNRHPIILQGHLHVQLVAWTVSGIPCKVGLSDKAISLLCASWRSNSLLTLAHREFGENSAGINPLVECSRIPQINSTKGKSTAPQIPIDLQFLLLTCH